MSDVEQRLRSAHPNSQQYAGGSMILLEAADEISRLQFELSIYKQRVTDCDGAIERREQMWADAVHETQRLRGRVAAQQDALYSIAVALNDAGNLSKEMHDLIVSATEGSGDAWLLNKQAEAVESTWQGHCRESAEEDCKVLYQEDMQDAVNNLRQQADKAEKAGGDQ